MLPHLQIGRLGIVLGQRLHDAAVRLDHVRAVLQNGKRIQPVGVQGGFALASSGGSAAACAVWSTICRSSSIPSSVM